MRLFRSLKEDLLSLSLALEYCTCLLCCKPILMALSNERIGCFKLSPAIAFKEFNKNTRPSNRSGVVLIAVLICFFFPFAFNGVLFNASSIVIFSMRRGKGKKTFKGVAVFQLF